MANDNKVNESETIDATDQTEVISVENNVLKWKASL